MDTSCTRAEINLGAIAHNTRELRRITSPEAQLMAVVKANGYGHGVLEVARTALKNGASALAVARMGEGIQIREAGIDEPILVFGYTSPDHTEKLVHYNLTQTVGTTEFARAYSTIASKQGIKLTIHLIIDTGMGRLGFLPDPLSLHENTNGFSQITNEIESIARLPNLFIEGFYTHFACADSKDKSHALGQFKLFNELLGQLYTTIHFQVPIRHAANSAAVIDLPETHLDMVRTGISLYGLYPSEHVDKNRILLKPAMEIKSKILHLKIVPKGFQVSYGGTWQAAKKTTIATIPMGYADGYNRLFSSRGHMLVHGKKAPIAGRVCMDLIMIDVGAIPDVKIDDEVVVFGKQGDEYISVDEIAKNLGTINYEIVSTVTDRVQRLFLK